MGNGAVPDGWRSVRLGDIASVMTGGTPARGVSEYWGGDVPWMSSGEIHKRRVRHVDGRISTRGLEESNARMIPAAAVLLAMNGQGKTRGTAAFLETPTSCNQSIAAVVVEDPNALPEYVFFNLESRYEELRNVTGDAARTGLNLELIRGLTVALPPPKEQRRSVQTLCAVDDAIERTETVITRAAEAKQAIAHELLTRGLPGRHTRLKQTPAGEIPEDWEVVHFGDLIADGPTNGLYKHESEYGDGTAIVRVDDFYEGRFVTSKELKRVRATAPEVSIFSLAYGHILINRVNSLPFLGKCALVPPLNEPTVYESNMMRLTTDATRFLAAYAVEWLCSREALRQIQARAKKAVAQASISQGDVRDLLVPLPPLGEQQAAMELLGAAEQRVDLERGDLGRRRGAKEQLARALLTGEMRVPSELLI